MYVDISAELTRKGSHLGTLVSIDCFHFNPWVVLELVPLELRTTGLH